MTTTEAAREWGVSRRTVSKWCRTGKLPEGWTAAKVRRRWVISPLTSTAADGGGARLPAPEPPAQEAPMAEWPDYIRKEYAIQDGLTPEDFRFDQWPVSDVRLTLGTGRYNPIEYHCRMPAYTPQPNQYEEVDPGTGDSGARLEYRKLPDPVGMALAWVRFQLRDADTHEKLHEGTSSPINGAVQSGVSGEDRDFWTGPLPPGKQRAVRLYVRPLFFYLNDDGGANLGYANMGLRGHFGGKEIQTGVHTLSVDDDGEVLIDGQKASKPAGPPGAPRGARRMGCSAGARPEEAGGRRARAARRDAR